MKFKTTHPGVERTSLVIFLMPPFILALWGGVFLDLATSGRLRLLLNPLFWPVEIVCGLVMLVLTGGYLLCFRPQTGLIDPKLTPRLALQAAVLTFPIVAASCLAPPSFSAAALERRASLSGGRVLAHANAPHTDRVDIVDLAAAAYYPEHIPELSGKKIDYTGQYFHGTSNEFRFCRVLMSCCAQDATPIYLRVVGDAPKFAEMQWIQLQGETFFRKDNGEWIPCVRVQNVSAVKAPGDPYLYPATLILRK